MQTSNTVTMNGCRSFASAARLAEEPLLEAVIGLEVGPDDLDGDEPVQERLAALVDDPHAALTQQLDHFQVGEPRSQLRGRRRREPRLGAHHRLIALDCRLIRQGSSHGIGSTECLGLKGSTRISRCGWS